MNIDALKAEASFDESDNAIAEILETLVCDEEKTLSESKVFNLFDGLEKIAKRYYKVVDSQATCEAEQQ